MTAYLKKGFTLIELLIVMAILGVLAVVVLVAINPVQQLARTRDAGRKSGISQIGRAMEAYYTAHGGSYLAGNVNWLTNLEQAGEISTVPSAIQDTIAGYTDCGDLIISNWCYDVTGISEAVVYTTLESQSETSKCAAGQVPVFVWSTVDGRGGLVCDDDGDIDPGPQTWSATQ
jgi:prepilin-type N-terminal cleavage/methylation domain-containing protein